MTPAFVGARPGVSSCSTKSSARRPALRAAPVRDYDREQERLNAHRAALRARLIAQQLGTGRYDVDMFTAKAKAR